MYQGRPTPGAVFLGAGIATLGTGIALEFVRSNARTRYLGATQAAEIESRYQTYNRAQKAEAWAFAAFAVLYLASEIDVFTNSASLSIGPAEHSASNGGVQMTLSLR
jgi:hypothetical protein